MGRVKTFRDTQDDDTAAFIHRDWFHAQSNNNRFNTIARKIFEALKLFVGIYRKRTKFNWRTRVFLYSDN